MQLTALKRYRHVFKLGDVPGASKEELIPAIQRHFAQQVVYLCTLLRNICPLFWLATLDLGLRCACACQETPEG